MDNKTSAGEVKLKTGLRYQIIVYPLKLIHHTQLNVVYP